MHDVILAFQGILFALPALIFDQCQLILRILFHLNTPGFDCLIPTKRVLTSYDPSA